jgi:hypothetical protein
LSSLFDNEWVVITGDPRNPITPEKSSEWIDFIKLSDVMPFHSYGIKQNRTWVNDPNKNTLIKRWKRLANSQVASRGELLKETDTRSISSRGVDLANGEELGPINIRVNSEPVSIVRSSYRTLDRQYLLADSRVIDRPRPELWQVNGSKQIYFSAMEAHAIGEGPGLTIAPYIPDNDHFKGNSSGWVYPVFRDSKNQEWNLLPGLLEILNDQLSEPIDNAMLFSYIAGVTAFPAFSSRFTNDLREGGVRLPLTLHFDLFKEVADLGSTAIELFTYCEKTLDIKKVQNSVRLKSGPYIVGDRATFRGMPESAIYDPGTETLKLGELTIGGVAESVWSYQVSGMPVVKKWIGYRKSSPSTKWSSPLNEIITESWPKAWTEELLDLLHVITQLRTLEPKHESLLKKVLAGPLLSNAAVTKAGLLPAPAYMTKPANSASGLL